MAIHTTLVNKRVIVKIKQLRLNKGCYALMGSDNIMSSESVKIEMIGSGNFIINANGKVIFMPQNQIHFAICENDVTEKKK